MKVQKAMWFPRPNIPSEDKTFLVVPEMVFDGQDWRCEQYWHERGQDCFRLFTVWPSETKGYWFVRSAVFPGAYADECIKPMTPWGVMAELLDHQYDPVNPQWKPIYWKKAPKYSPIVAPVIVPIVEVEQEPEDIQEPVTIQDGSVVYFIISEGAPFVKIGVTGDIDKRLRALQSGCPLKLTLAGTIPGDSTEELRFHQKFKTFRSAGEWFRLEGELAEFVCGLGKKEFI